MRGLKIIFSLILMLTGSTVFAQQSAVDQYNENSINPIPRYEQLFKHRVWLKLDLKEKQNKGFFARGQELTAFIINAARAGKLPIYKNDSLTTEMTIDEFEKNLTAEAALEKPEAWNPDMVYYADEKVTYQGEVYAATFDDISTNPAETPEDWQKLAGYGAAITYEPRQISTINIKEDMIFDKRRSRLYHKIQSLELVIPGSEHREGISLGIGVFSYKDLYNLFREEPAEAVWVNRYNPAENKNFADAFELRLFRASLFKFENPDDDKLVDMYKSNFEAVMASEWWEMQLMEKEHNLWEY
ncbi:MAG: gliding motility protein GldN [Candidatus Cyclobacteriaceae bacterium M2_1C_046]